MLIGLWNKILALFGKKQIVDDYVTQENERFVAKYEDDKDINFTAIFANKLANYTISDSNIDIAGDNKRAELLKKIIKKLKKKLKKAISRCLGSGGVLVVPYVSNSKLYFNIISQSRLSINKMVGDDIVDCTVMAEHIIKDREHYFRWTDYTLKNGNLYIKYRATHDDTPIEMSVIPEWANIQDISITNVDRMPFMYVKSPVDSRKEAETYGVPITFGCDKQIDRIMKDLEQIDREYGLKEAFVGADVKMFKGDDALPTNGLYKKINAGDDDFWEVFDPAFRDTSLYNKLMNDFALLEKQVGTSKGIITEVQTTNATATEIKKMLKETFDMVDDIRDSLEDGLNDFLYACDVLANYFNLTPQGDYELVTDWSYDLLEDTTATYNQLVQGVNNGVIKKAELRQFIKPNETLDEAQAVVDEIKLESPNVKDLVGSD